MLTTWGVLWGKHFFNFSYVPGNPAELCCRRPQGCPLGGARALRTGRLARREGESVARTAGATPGRQEEQVGGAEVLRRRVRAQRLHGQGQEAALRARVQGRGGLPLPGVIRAITVWESKCLEVEMVMRLNGGTRSRKECSHPEKKLYDWKLHLLCTKDVTFMLNIYRCAPKSKRTFFYYTTRSVLSARVKYSCY